MPYPFDADSARAVLVGDFGLGAAFIWEDTAQGREFWVEQCDKLTPKGRAILRKWIEESTAKEAA